MRLQTTATSPCTGSAVRVIRRHCFALIVALSLPAWNARAAEASPTAADAKAEAKAEAKSEAKAAEKAEAKGDAKGDAKAAEKAEPKAEAKGDAKADADTSAENTEAGSEEKPAAGASEPPKTKEAELPLAGRQTLAKDSVRRVIGAEVKSGKSAIVVATIANVLVDPEGRIVGAVLDYGGFMGVGKRRIAVAWSLLTFETGKIILALTRDQLKEFPDYRDGEDVVLATAPAPPN